ncbi:MAG: energy transducer TonB [Opitutales bacterium]
MSKDQYKPPKFGVNPVLLGLGALAISFAIGILLPLTQLLNPGDGKKIVRSVEVALPPPPPPPISEPPPPPDTPEEPPPPPDQSMEIDLSQLDISLNAGVGNVMTGAFAFKGFAAKSDAMSEMKIFNLADLDRKPKLLRKPSVKYPPSLKRNKVEGNVRLLVLINERGSVKVLKVLSSDHPEFTESATKAVERSRYEAPKKNGQPVRTKFLLPVGFTL